MIYVREQPRFCRDELSFYLSRVHFYALKVIFNNYIKNGMYDKNKAEWIDDGRGLNLTEILLNY